MKRKGNIRSDSTTVVKSYLHFSILNVIFLHSCLSVHTSVPMAQISTHWTDFMTSDIWQFFKNPSRKFRFDQYL